MERKLTSTMFSRVGSIVLVTLLVITALTGCSSGELTKLKSENEALKEQVELLENSAENLHASLLGTAVSVMAMLADEDFESLSAYVHPSQGLRFSPYAYVDVEKHLKFDAQEVPNLPLNKRLYTWGAYDGSGEPIELGFMDYYKQFVYDHEFVTPHIVGIDRVIGLGNTLVNIADVHPNGSFVEFHFTGFDPQYEGIDWSSLFLIFEQLNGKWFLVGIAHNEWTI